MRDRHHVVIARAMRVGAMLGALMLVSACSGEAETDPVGGDGGACYGNGTATR